MEYDLKSISSKLHKCDIEVQFLSVKEHGTLLAIINVNFQIQITLIAAPTEVHYSQGSVMPHLPSHSWAGEVTGKSPGEHRELPHPFLYLWRHVFISCKHHFSSRAVYLTTSNDQSSEGERMLLDFYKKHQHNCLEVRLGSFPHCYEDKHKASRTFFSWYCMKS